MANESRKKGKKTKGATTLSLKEFLGDDSSKMVVKVPSSTSSSSYSDPPLVIDRALLPSAPRAAREGDANRERVPLKPPFTAYVGNLPYDVEDEDLREFFRDLDILNVRIPKDADGGRVKGFGYVEFAQRDHLVEALAKNEELLHNRKLRVDLAEEGGKDGRGADGRGGGRGGFGQQRDDREPSRSEGVSDWRSGGGEREVWRPKEERGERRGGGGGSKFGSYDIRYFDADGNRKSDADDWRNDKRDGKDDERNGGNWRNGENRREPGGSGGSWRQNGDGRNGGGNWRQNRNDGNGGWRNDERNGGGSWRGSSNDEDGRSSRAEDERGGSRNGWRKEDSNEDDRPWRRGGENGENRNGHDWRRNGEERRMNGYAEENGSSRERYVPPQRNGYRNGGHEGSRREEDADDRVREGLDRLGFDDRSGSSSLDRSQNSSTPPYSREGSAMNQEGSVSQRDFGRPSSRTENGSRYGDEYMSESRRPAAYQSRGVYSSSSSSSNSRDRYDSPSNADAPALSRPRLKLAPRTKPLPGDGEDPQSVSGSAAPSASIFGAARPVDTVTRERELERRRGDEGRR